MNLLRAAATVSGLTLLSRVTGLVREYLTAVLFGANAMTDAFFVAFRLPNLLRRLFAEGAFSQAFVPILARMRASDDPQAAKTVIDKVATALFWVLLMVSVAGVIGAPVLVWLTASGLGRDPQAFDAAVVMTRWMFPYIGLISLVALAAGILNTWRHFVVPAATPVALNLCVIVCALAFSGQMEQPVYALALGVMLGGVVQVAMQWLALAKLGLVPRISFGLVSAFRSPVTREVLGKMAPAVLAVSVAQISLLINTHIASLLAAGSVSWVTYGDRLMEFPIALLGVALGTVLLPSLSSASAKNDLKQYNDLLDWGLRLTLVFSVPAMVGLGLLAQPLTALLFHYGRFTDTDVLMTARAVQGYAVGISGLIAIKVLAPGFYARQDVKTPVKIALIVLVITQLLNMLLVPRLAHAGLAWSISLAAWLNAGLLYWGLRRGGLYSPLSGWGKLVVQIIAAGLLMGAALWWSQQQFDWLSLRSSPWTRIGLVMAHVIGGAAVYLGVLMLSGVRIKDFLRKADVA